MQCALFRMVTQSVGLLVAVIETPCQCCLSVADDLVWGLDLTESPFKPAGWPVFHLYLKMEEDGPYLTTRPAQYEEAILQVSVAVWAEWCRCVLATC